MERGCIRLRSKGGSYTLPGRLNPSGAGIGPLHDAHWHLSSNGFKFKLASESGSESAPGSVRHGQWASGIQRSSLERPGTRRCVRLGT
jgi:hypothetical protein